MVQGPYLTKARCETALFIKLTILTKQSGLMLDFMLCAGTKQSGVMFGAGPKQSGVMFGAGTIPDAGSQKRLVLPKP